MTEQTLLNYFQNAATVEHLAEELKDSQQKSSYDTTSVYVTPIATDKKFNVTSYHLIKLCDDVISGKLTLNDINTIAFTIISSDFFTWDDKTEDAALIETVIYDWDNPEIGFDLTLKNMELWKEYLKTGNYNLSRKELKAKFRNDGK